MGSTDQAEGVTFASLDESSIPEVIELYRESIQPLWREQGRDHDLGRIEENMRQRLGREGYWMTAARCGGALVGYSAWERHRDHTSHHVVAHLRMLLVRSDQQGAGLGKALMARFEGEAGAEGCTKILFDVVVGSPAYDFYRSQGYRHWSNYMEKIIGS